MVIEDSLNFIKDFLNLRKEELGDGEKLSVVYDVDGHISGSPETLIMAKEKIINSMRAKIKLFDCLNYYNLRDSKLFYYFGNLMQQNTHLLSDDCEFSVIFNGGALETRNC